MTSADKLGMIVAVAVVIIFVGLGVGMSNVTPDTPRPSMEQQAMAPKIIESSSKEKIPKDKDIELKAKLDDKKIPTKLHKVSKDLKDTKMKLTSKLSPEIKERVKMTMDSWKAEKMMPPESIKPSTEKYFGECVSDPPPRLSPFSGTNWDHCDVSYLMFYEDDGWGYFSSLGADSYESHLSSSEVFGDSLATEDISMINSNAKQILFNNYELQNVNGASSDLTLSEFTNVKLKDVNLNHAKIGGIHFINSNLYEVDFRNASCNEMIPGAGDYYPCIFENVYAQYITGEESNWKNVYIIDSLIDEAFFMDSIISDLTILNSGIYLTGDILNNISITNSEVTLNVDDGYSSSTDEDSVSAVENAIFENSWIVMSTTHSDISEITANNSFIFIDSRDAIFDNVVTDNTFVHFDLSSMEINNMRISNAVPMTYTCTYLGYSCIPDPDGEEYLYDENTIDVYGGSMDRVIIENSVIDELSLDETEMSNVVIRNSVIDELSLDETEMSNVKIIDSVIDRAYFEYVDLSTIDFSGTEIIDGTFIGVTTGDTPLGCTGHPICD